MIISLKQRKIKFDLRLKLNHSILLLQSTIKPGGLWELEWRKVAGREGEVNGSMAGLFIFFIYIYIFKNPRVNRVAEVSLLTTTIQATDNFN